MDRNRLDDTLDALAPKLLRYCRGISRQTEHGEDAAQEALLALVDRWRRIGPPDDPSAFAFTIARRRLRRRLWRARFFGPLDDLLERQDTTPGPEAAAEIDQRLGATLDALDQLRPRDREALLLVSAAELDTASAARVLGIGPSALKMRVHRARQRLMRLLETEHVSTRPAL